MHGKGRLLTLLRAIPFCNSLTIFDNAAPYVNVAPYRALLKSFPRTIKDIEGQEYTYNVGQSTAGSAALRQVA